MTYRMKYDVLKANGITDHLGDPVELQKWSATEVKAQLKRLCPTAKSIKILDHDPK